MRNTVMVLMGDMLQPSALRLKQYILQQGEPSVADYLQVISWVPKTVNAQAGQSLGHEVSHCVRTEHTDNDFCSDLSDAYQVSLSQTRTLSTDAEVSAWWSDLFSHTVTLQHQGDSPTLQLCIVVPLWDSQMTGTVTHLSECLKRLPHNIEIDVFALPPTIAHLYDADLSVTAARREERTTIAQTNLLALQVARRDKHLLHAIIMIEDCNTQGVALELDFETWVRIMGEYIQVATENYLSLFPITLSRSDADVMTFGLSILRFDRYYFIHYLLRRAYIKILGREDVGAQEVDINKVAQIAQEQLTKHHHVFSQLYAKEIEPKIKQGLDDNTILAQISPLVEAEARNMKADFLSFIEREDLSLPEKQATLAQLLGLNDSLYAGNLFSRDQLVYEDCGSDAVDLFIRENNLLGQENSVLKASRHPETGDIYSPIEELKQARLRITESDRFIRQKQQEMEQWQQQITESIECEKRLTPEGFVYGDVTYRFMADEEEIHLFEENYEPHDVSVESIDMRSLFTDIRNQGQLGACTVFAMVGVYEFLLKKLSKPNTDLSEHFVYYNVSVREDGQVIDQGSSIHDVAQSMSEKGVCLEELCRYDGMLTRPSDDAYHEAQNHLLKQARNIPLSDNPADNHKALVSALADGYPVIISLKLYDSFASGVRGFVPRPSAEEKRLDKHGNHCMVICGFSNEEKVFIVRNSWGRNFGDSGYCYIPYSYIDDHAYLNQASIITQIAESDNLGGFTQVTTTKVSFSTTDAAIRYAIAANQIGEEQVRFEEEMQRYRALADQYYSLMGEIDNNANRRRILDGAEQRLKEAIEQQDEAKREFINVTYPQQVRQLRQSQKSGWIVWGSLLTACLLVFTVFISYETLREWVGQDFWITLAIIGGLIVLGGIAYKMMCTSAMNNLLRELDARRDQLTRSLEQLKKERSAKHLKLHIAGMFITPINKVQHTLDHKYKLLCSYVGNLSQWMADEKSSFEQMTVVERNPFIPVLRNDVLDRYFEANQDAITESVRLYSMLDKVGLSDEEIVRYKTLVRDKVASILNEKLTDFNMADYVLGLHQYPYLSASQTDIEQLMSRLSRQSDCFMRLRSRVNIDQEVHLLYVMLHTSDDETRQIWQQRYARCFAQTPSDVPTFASPMKLMELQVRHILLDQIIWMQGALAPASEGGSKDENTGGGTGGQRPAEETPVYDKHFSE